MILTRFSFWKTERLHLAISMSSHGVGGLSLCEMKVFVSQATMEMISESECFNFWGYQSMDELNEWTGERVR